jgi:hypothetical protein
LMVDPIHGLGRDLNMGNVDRWSFYEAAQYNDQWVSDGLGGVEPRFTFNGILNTQEDAASVLQAVASTMRAQFYTAGGVVLLAQDRPPVSFDRVFAPSNVIDGIFDYQSTEARSRVTHANVAWVDPAQGYTPQLEPVPYPEMMGRFGYRELGITAMGCTSRGQAIRAGRYFLFAAHREQETISFRVGLENADLRPGDVIGIQDPSRAAIDWSGRVVSRAGTVFTLDRPVDGGPGGNLWLTSGETVAPGSRVLNLAITGWPAADRVATAAGPDLTGMDAGTIWALTGTVALQQFRVLTVAEQEGLIWQISAIKHDPTKYTFVETGLTLPEPTYTAIPSGPLAPPTDPRAEDYYWIDPAGEPQAGIVFSWTPSTDSRVIHYIVDAMGPGRVGRHWSTVPGTTITLMEQATTGEWTFNVAGEDAVGRRSIAATLVVNTATIARVPMGPLALNAYQAAGYQAYVSWMIPNDISISYWVLKWTPDIDNPLWDAAIIVQAMIPRRLLSIIVPAQDGIFLMKSVSVRGVESAETAMASIRVSDIRPIAVSRIEQPTWTGTKVNCTVDTGTGELFMAGLPARAFMAMRARAERPVLAVPFEPRRMFMRGARAAAALASLEYTTPALTMTMAAEVIAKILLWGRGVIAADYMINWIPLSSAQPLRRTTSAAWDAAVTERYLLADGTTWSDWGPAGGTQHLTTAMQFRLTAAVFSVATDLRFGRMEESLMLVPYEQAGAATTSASGVVTVPLNPTYYSPPLPYVRLTQTGGPTGMLLLTGLTGSQFTVQSFTPSGAVNPTVPFNWVATGYGRRT